MRAKDIDLSELDTPQKVALMERLWNDLTNGERQLEPPEWHTLVLMERELEWSNRAASSEDWPSVREELRRDLR